MTPRSFIVGIIKKYPLLVFLALIASFSGALFNSVSVALIVPIVLKLLNFSDATLEGGPPILSRILAIADPFPEKWQGLVLVSVILVAMGLKNLTAYITTYINGMLSRRATTGLQVSALRLLLTVDLDFFTKFKIGDITNRFGTEISRTTTALTSAIGLASTSITIFGFVLLLLSISWQLTIVAIISLSVAALLNQISIYRAKQYGSILSDKSAAQTSRLIEVLRGIRLVKTVAEEEEEIATISGLIHERSRASFFSQLNFALVSPINEMAGITSLLIIILWGRTFFAESLDSLSGVLLTYLVLLFRLLPFVAQLNRTRGQFANCAASINVVSAFLDTSDKPFMRQGDREYTGIKRRIRFERVNFGYPGATEPALNDISLDIERGETVALVGTSGAGKSTLADLVPRFYDPTDGRITVDGVDLRDFSMRSVRRAMGVVSQDTFLFNSSVRYNLMYGSENKTEADLIDAAKRANAYEFIVNMSEGFDTEIGERGVMLSGGQRQRLAIARALLRDPDVLILDEATSALDTVSERLVQQAIEELCHDRTTLVIAHRLSTIRNANKIVVMEKGCIVEVGSHNQLIAKGGAYAKLYDAQFSQENKDALQRARVETLMDMSYEVRTRLNPMIGFLNLLVDDDVESGEERQELIDESYDASVRLLRTLQFMENSAKEAASTPPA
ncbi:MAG: ATP-binding cassette domain-containing protein [Geitlerinemataceae cyanobacterium]